MVGMAETVPVSVRAWIERHNAGAPGGGEAECRLEPLAKSAQTVICRKAADYMPPIDGLTRRHRVHLLDESACR
jgi:hypothetical protein